MKLLKFLLPALLALALPLIGLINNDYVFVNSFPYGAYVHSSIAIANFLFKALLFIGVIGLIVGLASPKFSYFSTNPNRINVITYYSFVLLLSFISYRELVFFVKFTADIKKPALSDFYHEVGINEDTKTLISKIQTFKFPLQWWGGDSSGFNQISGFPYRDPTAMIIQIHFPGLTEKSKIVVEISDRFDNDKSRVTRVVLIENNKVILSNPKLKPEDPQILIGSFEKIDGKLMFHACGDTQLIEADLSQLKEKFIFGFADKEVFGKKFAIFSGSFISAPKCSNCNDSITKLYVYHGVSSHNEESYSCKFGF